MSILAWIVVGIIAGWLADASPAAITGYIEGFNLPSIIWPAFRSEKWDFSILSMAWKMAPAANGALDGSAQMNIWLHDQVM